MRMRDYQERIYDALVTKKLSLNETIDKLNEDIRNLNAEKRALTGGREPRYIVKFKIKQGTFTLDPFEHVKNEMNSIEVEFPVNRGVRQSVWALFFLEIIKRRSWALASAPPIRYH